MYPAPTYLTFRTLTPPLPSPPAVSLLTLLGYDARTATFTGEHFPNGSEWKVGVPSGAHNHAGSRTVVEKAFKKVLPVEKAVLLAAGAVTTEATAWTHFLNESREGAGYVGLTIKDRQPSHAWIRDKMATWVRPDDVALRVRIATPLLSPSPSASGHQSNPVKAAP